MISILEKSRQDVDDVVVELDAERAEDPPKVFTRIHMHFIVKGRNIDAAAVERAITLSVDKYCSATTMRVIGSANAGLPSACRPWS